MKINQIYKRWMKIDSRVKIIIFTIEWGKKMFGIIQKRGNMSEFLTRIFSVLKCVIFVLLFTQGSCFQFSGNSSRIFVERCRRDCVIQRDAVVCGRYKVVRWLQDAKEKVCLFLFQWRVYFKICLLNKKIISFD